MDRLPVSEIRNATRDDVRVIFSILQVYLPRFPSGWTRRKDSGAFAKSLTGVATNKPRG